MTRVLIGILLILLNAGDAFSQFEDKISVTLPSPGNLSAANSKSFDVDFYRGAPQIVLPLHTLESSDLDIGISLKYNATGIKLQDYSSPVGTGWELNAGGMITRIIRGRPDESDSGYIGLNRTGLHINSAQEVNADRSGPISKGEWDGEPDLFIIVTPYESNSFIFDENKNVLFSRPTKMQVSMSAVAGTNNYTNVSFTVTDENGNQFKYGTSSVSREIVGGDIPVISSWLLDEIKSLNSNDVIQLNYIAGPNVTTNRHLKFRMFLEASGVCAGGIDQTWDKVNSTTYVPKYIKTISCAKGKVEFQYGANRQDLANAFKLTAMDVFSGSKFLKRIKLNHDYYSAPVANQDMNRLALKDIVVIGSDQKLAFKLFGFSYFNNPANNFPARSSTAIDHWGYYNNNSPSTPLPPQANKEPDLEKTKQYSLSEIVYGLGGKTAFEYELNSYYDNVAGVNKNSGGLRIKKLVETDNTGAAESTTYTYTLLENGVESKSSGEHFVSKFTYDNQIKQYTLMPPTPGCNYFGYTTYNNVLFHLADLNGVNTGYTRVKVTHSNNSYEEYVFSNFSKYPDEFKIVNANFGTVLSQNDIRQFGYSTSFAHRRGKLETKTSFSSSGQKLNEVITEYGELTAPVKKARGVSISLEYRITNADVSRWYHNIYYHVDDKFVLKRRIERNYDSQQPSIVQEQTQTFEYNTEANLVRQVNTTLSNGTTNSTRYFYPENRAEITGLSTEDNIAYGQMLQLAKSIRQEITYAGGQKSITHESYKATTVSSVTKVYPAKTLEAERGGPLLQKSEQVYDFATGNLLTEKGKDGILKSYIYTPLKDVQAEIANATAEEVFVQDFESGSPGTEGDAETGSYYHTTPYTVPFTRPNQRKYILTYARLQNGKWERMMKDYTADDLAINEVTGTAIDNVVVAPEDAFVKHFTQIPYVGTTSELNTNGIGAKFEYDELQRLKALRDREGNVQKVFSYKPYAEVAVVLPKVTISYENIFVNEMEDVYREEADVILYFKDAAGNPVSVDGLVVKVKESGRINGTPFEIIHEATCNGTSQVFQSSAVLDLRIYKNGNVWRDEIRSFSIVAGSWYKL